MMLFGEPKKGIPGDPSLIRDGERVDDLQNGYYIIQNRERFCFGMDAVLLSGFVSVKAGEKVMDLGTGTGIIPILLRAKTEGRDFTGLEIQHACVDMASRSVLYNNLEDCISIREGDIKAAASEFGAASFDVVTVNPPYMVGSDGLHSASESRAIARHEILCTLEDVLFSSRKLLKERGRLYMVHRPFRLPEIFSGMIRHHLEPKRMQMVHPYADREPNMVLIEAVKGGNAGLKVDPALIVFEAPGVYTKGLKKRYQMV